MAQAIAVGILDSKASDVRLSSKHGKQRHRFGASKVLDNMAVDAMVRKSI